MPVPLGSTSAARSALAAAVAVALPLLPSPSQAVAAVPRFEPRDCWFEAPAAYSTACGHLIAPENRSRPNGRTVRLPVVWIKSEETAPTAVPVLIIGGGPGAAVGLDEESIGWWWEYMDLSPGLRRRGIILYEQRGVGTAEPRLDCPEVTAIAADQMRRDVTPAEERQRFLAASLACRDRLVAAGIDLQGYNTGASAADIADLRRVLDLESLTLYGISYGSRLALTVMRDYPEGIASAILDSVYPPEMLGFEGATTAMKQALDDLLRRCDREPGCRRSQPDLAGRFYALLDELDRDPIVRRRAHPDSGRTVEVAIDGGMFLGFLLEISTYAEEWRAIPRYIDRLAARDSDTADYIADWMLWTTSKDFGWDLGAYYSVECADEYPLNDIERIRAEERELRLFAEAAQWSTVYEVCAAWGAAPAGAPSKAPVRSAIPTLILNGVEDPLTPPSWAARTAESLADSRLYRFAGVAHSVFRNAPCGDGIVSEFLIAGSVEVSRWCTEHPQSLIFE